MNWIGEYIIDSTGRCTWNEGLYIQDDAMASAWKSNILLEFVMTTFATCGVKTGMA